MFLGVAEAFRLGLAGRPRSVSSVGVGGWRESDLFGRLVSFVNKKIPCRTNHALLLRLCVAPELLVSAWRSPRYLLRMETRSPLVRTLAVTPRIVSMASTKPSLKFSASPLGSEASASSLPLPVELQSLLHLDITTAWYPTLEAAYPHSIDVFQAVLNRMIHSPEHSSSTILRADILSNSASGTLNLAGFTLTRLVRRRLIAKLGRDGDMTEDCAWFSSTGQGSGEAALLLLPDMELLKQELDGVMPYYHPHVAAIAFRFIPSQADEGGHGDGSGNATLRIDLLPLATQPFPTPLPPTDRSYRTALMLAKQIVKESQGEENHYVKRVNHDLLAGKEDVQDLYRELKERYR